MQTILELKEPGAAFNREKRVLPADLGQPDIQLARVAIILSKVHIGIDKYIDKPCYYCLILLQLCAPMIDLLMLLARLRVVTFGQFINLVYINLDSEVELQDRWISCGIFY